MGIAELIRQKRIEKGLSLRDVAKYVGVSDVAVSKWEHGKIDNIRSDKLMKLSEILGISVIDLVLTEEERAEREAQRQKAQSETEDIRNSLKDNPKLRMLLSASAKLNDDDLAQLCRIAELMGKE